MKFTKSIKGTRLTDDHLNDVLRIATTDIMRDFEKLSKKRKKKIKFLINMVVKCSIKIFVS